MESVINEIRKDENNKEKHGRYLEVEKMMGRSKRKA